MYNFDTIVAMHSKLAMIILYSFHYTRKEFQALPTSCVGMASAHTTQQEAIYSFKRGICEAEGLMCP